MGHFESHPSRTSVLVVLAASVLTVTGLTSIPLVVTTPPPSWKTHVERVDQALATKDLSGAVMAWHDAYGAALGSREWEAMLAVGDASRRIGDATPARRGFDAKARQSYLTALFRARERRALEGVLGATAAFATLGDRDVVEQGLHIARDLARQNPEAEARVQAFAERLSKSALAATEH